MERTRVITLPPKHVVNVFLAIVAGALAMLVGITARDTFAAPPGGVASPALPSPTVLVTPRPTPATATPSANGDKGKGKGHD